MGALRRLQARQHAEGSGARVRGCAGLVNLVALTACAVCCVCVFAGSSLFGALSSMLGIAGGAPGSPRETVRALNAELATWETLAQVGAACVLCMTLLLRALWAPRLP